MLDVFFDALKDSLIVFPFLFAVYVLMELIENAKKKVKIERALSGAGSSIFAAVSGVIPECGFSVMCAKFYEKGLILTGTLVAAFISSNDEGLIVMISGGASAQAIATFVIFKVIYAAFVGLLLNVLLKKMDVHHVCPDVDVCIECGEHHDEKFDKFILHPLFHAIKTFLYILALNLVIGVIIYLIGEENLSAFISSSKLFQPIITALFGLIPNCASSIIIAQSYCGGIINFAGLIAGLSANAGMGLLILFRGKENIKRALLITAFLYVFGVIIGYISMPLV